MIGLIIILSIGHLIIGAFTARFFFHMLNDGYDEGEMLGWSILIGFWWPIALVITLLVTIAMKGIWPLLTYAWHKGIQNITRKVLTSMGNWLTKPYGGWLGRRLGPTGEQKEAPPLVDDEW
jgi:hypothetical protein